MQAALLTVLVLAAHRLTAQCPDGSAPPCGQRRAPPFPNSVAVLYFENISRDTAYAYLADGLTDEITARLGQITRLSVTARTTVRRLRNAATLPTGELGRALNVAYLVSGSVRPGTDRLRVTVELVRAQTGARVWGDQFDRPVADLLAIEEDVARAVATGIAGRLFPAEQATVAVRPTRNPEAYDHYLRGNRLLWRQTESSVLGALAEYQTALRLDSGFTAARGRLAYAYGLTLNWAYQPAALPVESLLARGVAAADRALREDSAVSDAWLGRALIMFFDGRHEDLEIAVGSARRALMLSPADDQAHQWHGVVLRRLGRFAEAEQEYRRALAINPWNVQSAADLGFLAYSERRFLEARQWYDSAVALDSTFSSTYYLRARVRAGLGDLTGALEDGFTALRLALPSERLRIGALVAEMEARNGQSAHSQERLQNVFTELGWPDGVPTTAVSVRNAYDPALAAIALGKRDVAIAILDHARPHGPWLWSYLIWPGFDPLRTDPRFIKIFDESQPPGAPAVPR